MCGVLSFQCVHISVEQVVCCRLTPLQLALYKSFVASQVSDTQQEEELKVTGSALSSITQLKKLCNRRRTVLLFVCVCVCAPFFLSLWLPFFVLFSLSFFCQSSRHFFFLPSTLCVCVCGFFFSSLVLHNFFFFRLLF